jgi:predicted DNA-binding transcriptional regulator AlpA
MTNKRNIKVKPDPFRDITFAEKFTGINRKTQRRWWEKNKFPKPVLLEGKLYWRESALNNWMNEKAEGVTG